MPVVQRDELWADKYRPRYVNEMCYPAMANRLKQWLEAWHRSRDDPQAKRAALLSGPPGVGKTTTVHLVAAELGYQVVEFNASDHRSAKSLGSSVSDIVDNRSMSGLGFGGVRVNDAKPPAGSNGDGDKLKLDRFVLLMDEVDGCDRGGVAEVISMIKRTKVPILCTCNDRWHQKLRSLVNHVEDMRFSRPPFNVVAAYIRDRVLAKEGCSVPLGLLQDVIKLEGNDIRSVLNNLQLWCRANKHMNETDVVKAARTSFKNEDVGLFSASETFLLQGSSQNANQPKKSIEELLSTYYSADLVDLFVQENYLHFKPERGDWMTAVARAAESISRADVVRRAVFVEQNWSVSNYHVVAAAITPCALCRGHYQTFLSGPAAGFDRSRPVKFPAWLGSNSTTTKNTRLALCLCKQARNPATGASANPEDMVMEYAPVLAGAVTQPLAASGKEGVPAVMKTMDQYKMIRDDWDFVQDVVKFKKMASAGDQRRVTAGGIAAATKGAFTRAYNAAHKGDQVSLRSKLGVVPEPREGGADDDEDDDESQEEGRVGEAPAKKARPEGAAGKKAPAAPAAGKGKARAPAKPRGKKAAAATPAGGASDPIIL